MPHQVFIGNLPRGCRERDIEDFFYDFGRIEDVHFKGNYAFVDFANIRDAEDAVHEMHDRRMHGYRVRVEFARGVPRPDGPPRRDYDRYDRDRGRSRHERFDERKKDRMPPSWYGAPIRTKYRLQIENVSTRISWQDLKDYCRQAGDVTYAECHKDEERIGIVEFASYDDMKACISKLDGSELNGRKVKMVEVNVSRSRSHSRSSRSRSRSQSGRRRRRGSSRSRSPHRISRSRSRSDGSASERDRYSRDGSPRSD